MLICVQLSQESIICKTLKYILYSPQENFYYKILQMDDIIIDYCWWIKAKDLLNESSNHVDFACIMIFVLC